MNDLQAMAESVRLSTGAVIGGRATRAASGKTFETLNPATGRVLAEIACCDAADVERAVGAARQAFDRGPWPRLTPSERKAILLRFANLIEAHAEELALMEALEGGKPISDALQIDLPETAGAV